MTTPEDKAAQTTENNGWITDANGNRASINYWGTREAALDALASLKNCCRAGWVCHLAGEDGKALEARFNTELAAMMIYRESGFEINPCRFYDDNEAALEDMQRLAEQEAAANV